MYLIIMMTINAINVEETVQIIIVNITFRLIIKSLHLSNTNRIFLKKNHVVHI